MPTTHAHQDERALGTARTIGDLPALSTVDRVALRVGLALILWGQHHAEREERALAARQNGDEARASAAARDAFEHRTWSGTTV